MSRILLVVSCLAVVSLVGCGGGGSAQEDSGLPGPCQELCQEKPACGDSSDTVVKQGTAATLINKLTIGTYAEGFDFNADGEIDNSLAALGSLANSSIKQSIDKGDLTVPFEFFDLEPTTAGAVNDQCVHFAVYVGKYPQDADQDGYRVALKGDRGDPGNDCADRADDPIAKDRYPGHAEVDQNRADDNCNGLADEVQVPPESIPDGGCNAPSRENDGGCLMVPADTEDKDGDGFSLAQGDCDDRDTPEITINGVTKAIGAFSYPGAKEVCGDGLDNDCNGVADDGCNAWCDPVGTGTTACNSAYVDAHGDGVDTVSLDPLSVDGTAPKISFVNGSIENGVLHGGPSIFALSIPVTDDMNIDFRISSAIIEGKIDVDSRGGVTLTDTILGGVLGARDLAKIQGLDVSDINLTPEDSLLDVVFVAFLAKANLLGLKQVQCHPLCPPDGCLIPDVDVDGDGYECFIDDDPNDGVDRVTLCVDGDGTEVRDGFEMNADGTPKSCTEALGPDGKPRFVDGLSITLKFSTLPVNLGAVEPSN
jgi:hypothetical protein